MKVALVGLGRTGKTVAEYLLEKGVLSLILCREESKHRNLCLSEILNKKSCGTIGLCVETTERLEEKLMEAKPDVLIDFSRPEFLREHIGTLEKCGVNVVTAVTEYSAEDIEQFEKIGEKGKIAIITAPNITFGVNVMMLLSQIASTLMKEYDFEIVEEHFNKKRDMPSGTAKKLAFKIDEILRRSRKEAAVPVHSIRAGGIIGKHKVVVAGEYDKIEITHESFSRMAFADGAYKAAKFIVDKVGYYRMEDVFSGIMQQNSHLISAEMKKAQ